MNSDPTTRTSKSADWDFPTLAYVWDYKIRAIIAGADRLEGLSDADRTRSLTALSERVRALAGGLDDGWLVATAFFMIDDLYKSYFCGFRWSSGVADYIAGVRGPDQFASGHAQRAVIDRVTRRWGGAAGFVKWFDDTEERGE